MIHCPIALHNIEYKLYSIPFEFQFVLNLRMSVYTRVKIKLEGKPYFGLAFINCSFPLCSFFNEMHLHPRNPIRLTPKTLFFKW